MLPSTRSKALSALVVATVPLTFEDLLPLWQLILTAFSPSGDPEAVCKLLEAGGACDHCVLKVLLNLDR